MTRKERVERMVEVFCNNLADPMERVYLKKDLFEPIASLPEVVETMLIQDGTHRRFILKHLSKEQLIQIEKNCIEDLVLSRALLDTYWIYGCVDSMLKKIIREENPFLFRHLDRSTRSRLVQAIAEDIWQNIFDALLDHPELRKVKRILLKGLFEEKKNGNVSYNCEAADREKNC